MSSSVLAPATFPYCGGSTEAEKGPEELLGAAQPQSAVSTRGDQPRNGDHQLPHPALSMDLHKAPGQTQPRTRHCRGHRSASSSGTPPALPLNYSPRGQLKIIKELFSLPEGIYFNLYITCNFLLILFLFYFFLNSIFCIRYHYCEEIMLI